MTTPLILDASYNNPNAQAQVNGLSTTYQNTNAAPSMAYGMVNTPTLPKTINSGTAASTMAITLPPTPTDSTNYAGIIANGNAQAKAIQASIDQLNAPPVTPTATADTPATSAEPSWYQKIVDQFKPSAPASTSDAYATAEKNAGISSLQTDVNTKNQAVLNAQSKLASLNAQLQGITDEATVKNLGLQNEGGAITTNGVAVASQANIRESAIKAIPLQVQVLGAQAEVAAAQGNAQLSESILSQAQTHLDKLFQLQEQDVQNKYKYQTDLFNSALQIADKAETKQLEAKKTALATNQSNLSDARNFAQSLSSTALSNGQANIASQLASLQPPDINSKTFANDLQKYNTQVASLQKQIQTKPTTAQTEKTTITNVNSQLTKSVGSDGYTDPNLYARLRASSTLSGSDFDNRFSYLVNPASRQKLGLSTTTSNVAGKFTPTQQQNLIGTGIPSEKLDTLSTYINQYGLQAALTNSDMTEAQKTALEAVYHQ